VSKTFWYFFLLNVAYAVVVVTVYALGFEYDKANKLYPEAVSFGHTIIMGRHGQRWVRFLKYSVWLGVLADAVFGYFWYRRMHVGTRDNLSIK
jgi:hypothetical protein